MSHNVEHEACTVLIINIERPSEYLLLNQSLWIWKTYSDNYQYRSTWPGFPPLEPSGHLVHWPRIAGKLASRCYLRWILSRIWMPYVLNTSCVNLGSWYISRGIYDEEGWSICDVFQGKEPMMVHALRAVEVIACSEWQLMWMLWRSASCWEFREPYFFLPMLGLWSTFSVQGEGSQCTKQARVLSISEA